MLEETGHEGGLRPDSSSESCGEVPFDGVRPDSVQPRDGADVAGMWGDDPVNVLARATKELASDDYRDWMPGSLTDRVRHLGLVRERLEAEYVRLLAEWDRRQSWAAEGALSARGWLTHHTPVNRSEANRTMKAAQLVRDRTAVADALASESMSVAQVQALSKATTRGREVLFGDHESILIEAATGLDEDGFGRLVQQWSTIADDQLGRASARHVHENRYLHLHSTFAGAVVVDGRLDTEAGARLQAALEQRVTPDPTDDPTARTAAQLRADALLDLVDEAEASTHTTNRSKVRANVNVIVDLPTLEGKPWSPVSTAELVGIGPIARETARRLLCDSHLTRVITNGPSQILDVGRNTRFVSEPQRAALVVRDGGCVFPTCDRDHRWTDAHHLTPHTQSPKTDLHDLVLLCRRHHTLVHEGGWNISRHPGTGEIHTRPPTDSTPNTHVNAEIGTRCNREPP